MAAALALVVPPAPAHGDEKESAAPPAPGSVVPDFSLPDIHRRSRSLAGFGEKRAYVIAFLGTECPLANLALPTLIDMHAHYSPKGVQFVAINSNAQDSFLEVSAHAQERGVPFPVLKDFSHRVADAFGAQRTPEFFLLDSQRVLCYRGRLDDQNSIEFRRAEPTRRDLAMAIDELLAGRPVSVATTAAPGCLIGRADHPRVDRPVTYAKEVSRILQARCQECHRPGEVGPMSLLTHQDAKDWSGAIREAVLEERMPPWHADPRFGGFENDRRLSRDEADTLLAWVDQGCPKGDDADLPAPKAFVEGWTIGQPDKVFQLAEEFDVPASGVIDYQQFVVDPGFEEDVWIERAEARPGNRAVVHHILVYIQAKGKPRFAADGATSVLVGWAPGDMPLRFPPGLAKRIPAGSKLVFEVHYTPNGVRQKDRSSVGVIFASQPPQREVEMNILANMSLKIPAGAADHQAELEYTFRDDAEILSFMPHMHLRGLRARYTLTRPDGVAETLLFVPDYDFNWQSGYRFRTPIQAPKGSKLIWSAAWDNSADNPRNPDPGKDVGWGLQTWDEMQNGWMELVWKNETVAPAGGGGQ